MTNSGSRSGGGRPTLAGLFAVAVAACGLPCCAFCPAGLGPTAADKAAGLSCHFTPEQEALHEQREEGFLHPPDVSW